MRHTSLLTVLLMLILFLSSTAHAADVPDSLSQWEKWVLHGDKEQNCPVPFDGKAQRHCWWPSYLSLDVGDRGGLFTMKVRVYGPTWVFLPGDEDHWPESVAIGENGIPVTDVKERPAVWLTPGDWQINGAFVWDGQPERLQLPVETGIVSLTVDGNEIQEPDLDAQGRLRLQSKKNFSGSKETVKAQLFRLIEDGIPLRIVTRVMLQVSGGARDIQLASVLPAGATVMKVDSPLPVRISDDGGLLVQGRPGHWDIDVTVRLAGPVETLSMGKGVYGEETWSFKAANHLRMVTISGAPAVEPSRTRMPDAWKRFPAYQVKPGGTLSLATIRRGDPDPSPDQLKLTRTWWLDFDGSGFTVHDSIDGRLNRTWHLAMVPPMELGRVAVDGRDQLITLQGKGPWPGVQMRRGMVNLEADSRIRKTGSTLPAIGWDHDFQSVGGLLHLPPGWRLFAATGVDIPEGTWLSRWSLLDLFLALIISIGAYKCYGRTTGLVTLFTLALIFQEPGAPRQVWLHLLAAGALLRYLPDGWFKRLINLWRAAAIIVLIVIALPFMVQQVRIAIYPQLSNAFWPVSHRPLVSQIEDRLAPQMAMEMDSVSIAKQARKAMDKGRQLEPEAPGPAFQHTISDSDALIQTGPGLPAWRWQSVRLRWNGPVDQSQNMRLWLMGPFLNMVLGLARVALLAILTMFFLDLRNWRRHLPGLADKGVSMAGLLLVVPIFAQVFFVETAHSDFPPDHLLEELHQRLTEPPPCLPHCADVSRLELTATPDQLRLFMQIHAQADTAIPLPVTLDAWRPQSVMLNSKPAESLTRDEHGNLWMVVPKGVHQVKLTGAAGHVDEIRISFPLVPHMGTYAGVGWQARGFAPGGKMDATISLSRMSKTDEPTDQAASAAIPAFFHVTRTLRLGIQWEVTTHIQRLTPVGDPVRLAVPLLLPQAKLTTAGIRVEEGAAQIAMGPGETAVTFSTTLPVSPKIQLKAPTGVPWTETWILDAATIWRCTFSGITVIHHQDSGSNFQPQWQPWPGEAVTIVVDRPKPIPGRTVTIDKSRLNLSPGQRFTRAELTLAARTSRGGPHVIQLPEDINLQTVTVNGKPLPVRQEGQKITVPLEPGSQTVEISWLQLTDSLQWIRSPRIHVGDGAVNADTTIQMPDNRWILFTWGPRLGPAVLFWSYVIVVVVAAWGLGKTRLTPLRPYQWLLLGLGLTQIPAYVAVAIVGWLLFLGYRYQWDGPEKPFAFNLVQLLTIVLTLAALAGLYDAIEQGLLGIPDMQIAGNHSSRLQLNWTQDRIEGLMPTAWIISLPHWVYHLLMLAWSLWLAYRLIFWLHWGWGCFSKNGLWKTIRWRRKPKSDETLNVGEK